MPAEFGNPLAAKMIAFLRQIGIRVTSGQVVDGTFLPGIEVIDGGLVVDESKLLYPGDLLHEAGHLAVTPGETRSGLHGTVEISDAAPHLVELEAICWSYAACVYLAIDPRIVFHEHGYHGRSEGILRNFEVGVYLGLPGLEASGMTLSPADAHRLGQRPFPAMLKWLRD